MARRRSASIDLRRIRHERWSEAEGRAAVELWRASGLSMSAFAREHGLNTQRIAWWKRRLEDDVRDETAGVALAPVVVTGELGRSGAVLVRVGLVEIEVREPDEVDASWLAALVHAMGRAE
jgi:transposase-like protein